MNRRWQTSLLVVITVAAFFTAGWLMQRARSIESIRYGRLFEDVVDRIDSFYVDSLDRGELYRFAVEGLLEQLGDPYAAFLDTSDLQNFEYTTRGNYGGLGIEVDVRDGWITVIAPFPDSPADRLGIRPGDRIVQVDGVSTEGWTSDHAVAQLRGAPGSTVNVTIARGVDHEFSVDVERAEIHVSSVRDPMLVENGIGYVQLSPVRARSAAELRGAVDSLVAEGMTGLVLDLRSNPGGVLDGAIELAELFLDPGDEIVAQRGRAFERSYDDEAPQRWPELKLIVLVNQFTASAAEIVAGAVQDHDRGLIIGNRTFGKGLVQGLFRLGEPGTALKLTTARWYTPSGRSIHRPRDDTGRLQVEFAVVDTFHTEAGRAVAGGGGIIPDVERVPDDISDAERRLIASLDGSFGAYRDALTAVALDVIAAGGVPETFVATSEQAREVVRLLGQRGVSVDGRDAETVDLVAEQLTIEVLRFSFGSRSVRRRRIEQDDTVLEALRLLRSSESQRALLESIGGP